MSPAATIAPRVRNAPAMVDAYCRLGVAPALGELLTEEDADVALRVYLLDNSGSMSHGDGHVLMPTDRGLFQLYSDSRWAEVKALAQHHASWNAELGVPCEFILLNSPTPESPVNGRDFVRVDKGDGDGNVHAQCQQLAAFLHRTRPIGGTPLTERLEQTRLRLLASASGLRRDGKKVMLTIVTDGIPNGSRTYFAEALCRLARELPVAVVVRLCTDDATVVEFYDRLDRDIELSLDIVDDLQREAINVYKVNSWLTYTPVLQTIRESGTLSRIFDMVDERALTPMEVSLCAQLLLRLPGSPQYPRQPDAFLAAVERDLPNLPLVFDGRVGRAVPAIHLDALKAAIHPSKYTVAAQALQAVGLAGVAEWWFTGRRPWEKRDEEESGSGSGSECSDGGDAAHRAEFATKLPAENPTAAALAATVMPNAPAAAAAPSSRPHGRGNAHGRRGQRAEYYSTSHSEWLPCVITDVDSATGSVMLDVKPGAWITPEQAAKCVRTAPGGSSSTRRLTLAPIGHQLEYFSTSGGCWIPCHVTDVDATTGSIMINVKAGAWLTPEQQSTCIRARGTGEGCGADAGAAPAGKGGGKAGGYLAPQPAAAATARPPSPQPAAAAASDAGYSAPQPAAAAAARLPAGSDASRSAASPQFVERDSNATRAARHEDRRPTEAGVAAAGTAPPTLEHFTKSLDAWLPCSVVRRDPASGAIEIDLTPGVWITAEEQAAVIRDFSPAIAPGYQARVGDKVVYKSASQNQWLHAVVRRVNEADFSIMLDIKEAWISREQQAFCVRLLGAAAKPTAVKKS